MTTERTNRHPGHCNECGGPVAAGAGVLWWEAGPDDGGDVIGRTPAGWRVSHRTDAECAAHRALVAGQQAQQRATAQERYERWLTTAPAIRTVDEIDERDSYGTPLPQADRGAVILVQMPFPLKPAVYRKRADGQFDYLGEWRRISCDAIGSATNHAVTYPDDVAGWVHVGGSACCPEHAAQAGQSARPLAEIIGV